MATTVATESSLQPPVFLDKSGRQSPRPNLSSSKPSWIGSQAPPRAPASATYNMSQRAQIHYSHPGLQPPVFVAGSLGETQWEPIEMAHRQKEDGEFHFWHEFDTEPGEYQYKFRLGPGDWWALDETKPTVDDGTGNRNNLLVVEEILLESEKNDTAPSTETAATDETSASETISAAEVGQTQPIDETVDEDDDVPESEKNLFKHETMQHINDFDNNEDRVDDVQEDREGEEEEEEEEQSPLLDHEAGPFKRVDSKHMSPLKTTKFYDDPTELEVEADDAIEGDFEVEDAPCPLFRHETMSAGDADPDEAPLFRHESMSPVDSRSIGSQSPSSYKRHFVDSEDVNDPSLERFPTDEAGILARLQRAETRLREDQTTFEGTPLSPTLAQSKTFASQPPLSPLPADVNDLSHLDSIDETDETEDEEIREPLKKEPVEGPVSVVHKDQTEPETPFSKPAIPSASAVSDRSPPTPPMTPTEHLQGKVGPHDGPADDAHDPPRTENPRSHKANTTDNTASRSIPSVKSVDVHQGSFFNNFWVWFAGLCGGQSRATGVAIAMGVAAAAIAINARSN